MSTPRQLVAARIGETHLALDSEDVREVIQHVQLTSVPLAPRWIEGIFNLRGDMITAVDGRVLFMLGPSDRDAAVRPRIHLVLRHGGGTRSLLVDEVTDVFQLDPARIGLPPPSLPAQLRALATGTYQREGVLLLILSAASVGALMEGASEGPTR